MAKLFDRATLIKAKPWLIGAAIVGLFAWNMKQCNSLDDLNDVNAAQDAKIATVDAKSDKNSKQITELVKATQNLKDVVAKHDERINALEMRMDSVNARVDSIKPCPCVKEVKKVKKRKIANKKPCAVKQNEQSTVVSVPAQAATNVNVNGGCGNTVNVNNGTVNNYYGTPASNTGTVKIKSCASVTTVIRVVRTR